MKHFAALVILFFAVTAFADDIPTVTARQALDAAEKSMNDRGLDKEIYIESVVLTHSTMFGGEPYWFVKWSHSLPATDPNKREVGIKVRMDGTVTRLVKTPGRL